MAIRMVSDISHAKCEHFTRHPMTKRNVKHLDGAMVGETKRQTLGWRDDGEMGIRHPGWSSKFG